MDVNRANKTTLVTSPRLGPSALRGVVELAVDETDPDDLDEHFRQAIQRGDTNRDVVFLDEHGNEIREARFSKTIFDL